MNDTHTVLITLCLIEQRRLAKYAVVVNQNEVGFDFHDCLQYYGEHADNWIALTQANTEADLIKVELIEALLKAEKTPQELWANQMRDWAMLLSEETEYLWEWNETHLRPASRHDATLGEANRPSKYQKFMDSLKSTAKNGPTLAETWGMDQEYFKSIKGKLMREEYKFTPDNPPSLNEIDTLRKMEANGKPPARQQFHMPLGPTHTQPNGSEWQQWEVDTGNSVSHYWECINPDGTKERYPSDRHGWIDAHKHPCASIGLRVIVDVHHEGEEPHARTDQCVSLPDMGINPWLKFNSICLSRWMPQPQMKKSS